MEAQLFGDGDVPGLPLGRHFGLSEKVRKTPSAVYNNLVLGFPPWGPYKHVTNGVCSAAMLSRVGVLSIYVPLWGKQSFLQTTCTCLIASAMTTCLPQALRKAGTHNQLRPFLPFDSLPWVATFNTSYSLIMTQFLGEANRPLDVPIGSSWWLLLYSKNQQIREPAEAISHLLCPPFSRQN